MKIRLRTFLVILLVTAVASVSAVIAYQSWVGSITWSGIGTKDFKVWTASTGGTELTSPYDAPSPQFGPNTYTYYIENTGNVPITVTVTTPTANGCTASWSNAGTYDIAVGTTRVAATLTLTVTSDTGSYSWTFVEEAT